MPIGNPIRKQNESRMVSVLATEGQTVFTVQGGYIINHISVFRNGVRLSNSEDFTAGDGSTVTLNNAANVEDRIDFHIFDRFTVQNAIIGAASTQTINGDLVLNGKLFGALDVPSINLTGIVTATELDVNGKGDISGDLNVVGVTTLRGLSIFGNTTGLNVASGISTFQAVTGTTGTFSSNLTASGASNVLGNTTINGAGGAGGAAFTIDYSGTDVFKVVNTGKVTMTGDLDLQDDDRILLGTGDDLLIFHNGTTSAIQNSTNQLEIISDDIDLRSSTGDEHYFTAQVGGAATVFHNDNVRLTTLSTGVLITGTDDGDGGAKGDFRFMQTDGTLKAMFDASASAFEFYDNSKSVFGNGDDLSIYHDGSHSNIINITGVLKIRGAAGQSITFRNGDDSANVAVFNVDDATHLYHDSAHKFSTTSTGIKVVGNCLPNSNDTGQLGTSSIRWQELNVSDVIDIIDNGKIRIGDSDDMQLYHDGTTNYIECGASNFAIRVNSGNRLEINGTSGNVIMQGSSGRNFEWQNSSAYLNLNDNARLTIGSSNDLAIYHDGSHSYISEQGTGNLRVLTNSFTVNNTGNSANMGQFTEGGSVELFHNGSRMFETQSNGVKITNPNGIAVAQVEGTGSNRADVRILATGTGDAFIWMDASNGDLSGADYMYMKHSNSDLNFEISNYAAGIALKVRGGSLGSGTLDTAVNCIHNDRVELYFNGGKKFQTTSDGFETGTSFATDGSTSGVRCTAGSLIQTSENSTGFRYAARFYNPNGQVGYISTQNSNTTYNTSGSDRALKENFEDWNENTLDLFKNIKPQKFNFIGDEEGAEKTKGFIAQDMIDSFPEAYPKGNEEDAKYFFNPSGMVVYLMKALQEATTKIETLEARIAALEGS